MKKNLLSLFFILVCSAVFSQAPVVNSISGSSVLCSGIQIYTANVSGSTTSYFWSVQSSSPTAIIVINGYSVVNIAFMPIPMQYTITCTATNGSGSGQNSFVVQVYGTPTVTFSGARTICKGASSALSASSTMASSTMASPTLFYSWSPSVGINTTSSENVILSPTVTTVYTLQTISSLANCSHIDTITIRVYNPVISFSGVHNICKNSSSILSASSTEGILSCVWSPSTNLNTTSATSVVISSSVVGTTIYTLQTTSALGNCSHIDTITIYIDACTGINSHDKDKNETTVYPNPSNGDVYIKSNLEQIISVINELGQTVQKFTLIPNEEIKIVGLKSGVYFIVSTTTRKKIIITRE